MISILLKSVMEVGQLHANRGSTLGIQRHVPRPGDPCAHERGWTFMHVFRFNVPLLWTFCIMLWDARTSSKYSNTVPRNFITKSKFSSRKRRCNQERIYETSVGSVEVAAWDPLILMNDSCRAVIAVGPVEGRGNPTKYKVGPSANDLWAHDARTRKINWIRGPRINFGHSHARVTFVFASIIELHELND